MSRRIAHTPGSYVIYILCSLLGEFVASDRCLPLQRLWAKLPEEIPKVLRLSREGWRGPSRYKKGLVTDVEYLLLDLLQLILHLDDELLHGSVVALRAHGVDLTTYFLCDEA